MNKKMKYNNPVTAQSKIEPTKSNISQTPGVQDTTPSRSATKRGGKVPNFMRPTKIMNIRHDMK